MSASIPLGHARHEAFVRAYALIHQRAASCGRIVSALVKEGEPSSPLMRDAALGGAACSST